MSRARIATTVVCCRRMSSLYTFHILEVISDLILKIIEIVRHCTTFRPNSSNLSVDVVMSGSLFNSCSPEARHVIDLDVNAYHGSTALESFFMSSSSVATLCSGNAWQCEADSIDHITELAPNAPSLHVLSTTAFS